MSKPIRVRRTKLIEVVRSCQELEKRGYECIIPITKGYSGELNYDELDGYKSGLRPFYYTLMDKVESS